MANNKLKTNSSAKKRFQKTASGKVKYKPSGKRHGMTKRSKKQIRQLRKTTTLSDPNAKTILRHLLPYA